MIEIAELVKRYPGAEKRALDGLSLSIPAGAIFGILGPNGAGKTSLLQILLGLLPKDSGQVRVDGLDLDQDAKAVRRLFGLVPQEPAFYPTLTVAENIAFFAAIRGCNGKALAAERQRVCRIAGLERYLGQQAQRLSGGLKHRLNLAIGLLGKPPILCLDEPTVGVDPQSRQFILESVRALAEEGSTVLYTSHYMEEVQALCNNVAIMDEGRILVSGELSSLLGEQGGNVRLLAAQALSAEQAQLLSANFTTTTVSPSEIHISTDDAVHTVTRLAPLLEDSGIRLRGLQYGVQDLESLFLHLTGRQLRD